MRCVSRRLMPVTGSKHARRTSPESTTTRTPGMVRLVSAMFVASATLRTPRTAGASAASCCSLARSPHSRRTRTPEGEARGAREVAEQRQDLHAGGELRGVQPGVQLADLARSGQEHQHVAVLLV